MVSYGTSVTIGTGATYTFNRTLFNAAGADLWENIVQGARTGYANEGGELRSRAYNGSRVAFRCQSNVAGDGTTQSTFEVTKSDNTLLFGVDASGNLTIVGSIGGAGGYTTFVNLASLQTNVTLGTPPLQTRKEPGNVVRLQGELNIGGSFIAGATLATLPAGQFPANHATFTIRFTGTGAAAANWTIDASGNLSCSTALAAGNVVHFQHTFTTL